MKKIITILFILSSLVGFSQEYGNEWIDFNQSYFKIPVVEEGVYRITFQDLENAGAPLSSIDPRGFQVFHRGQQLAIHVSGENDAVFNPEDYLEFYGRGNDGHLDSLLYIEGTQPHKYYNLFSDTTYYFLTWKLNAERGRRMSSYREVNIDGLTPLNERKRDTLQLQTSRYAPGISRSNYARRTQFDLSEGWSGKLLQEGQSIDYNLSILYNAISTKNIELEIQILGESKDTHVVDILAGPDVNTLQKVGQFNFESYGAKTQKILINPNLLSNSGNLSVRLEVLGLNGNEDLISTTYVKINYPGDFNLEEKNTRVSLYPDPLGKSFVTWQNPPSSYRTFNITNIYNPIEILTISDHPESQIIRDNLEGSELFIFGNTLSPPIEPVNFERYSPQNYDYLIISNERLMQPSEDSANPVNDYAAYRASEQGGEYNPLVVKMSQIYNQFSYGEKTPLSIYNFVEFMKQGAAKFLFLIGKGTDVRNGYFRSNNDTAYPNLVPTAGFPGSDLAFSADMRGRDYIPTLATGRITAVTPEEVLNYLKKVQEMESLPYDNLWRKRILHLAGGITANEQEAFFQFTEGFGKIAEGNFFGGTVNTIRKNSLETSKFINISEQLNSGLNLITFFGHSNPNITDIDIGFVTDPLNGYNNSQKYPSFFVNGCEAGLIYNANRIFGEDWILAKDKGALAFLSHTSYGFSGFLRAFCDLYYQNAYGDSVFINKTMGEVHLETIKDYTNVFTDLTNIWHVAQIQQFNMQGDPAISLFGAKKPDYEILDKDLSVNSYDGGVISAQTDSFKIEAVVSNFGIAPDDSISIQIDRFVNNRLVDTYTFRKGPILGRDTIHFNIPGQSQYYGDNRFVFTLDSDFNFDELNELNNTAETKKFIPQNSTINVWPYDFSISNSTDISFIVQSTSTQEAEVSIQIEVDTTAGFLGPGKLNYQLSGDTYVEFRPDLSQLITEDSITIYWRTRLLNENNEEWNSSSFTYFDGSPPGWNQSHIGQIMKNGFESILVDEENRSFAFESETIKYDILTYGSENPALNTNVSIKINGSEYITNNLKPCRDNTLNLIAFNRYTAVPYAAVPYIFQDVRTCGRQPHIINSFTSNQLFVESGGDMVESLKSVNNGDTVLLFTIGNIKYSEWPSELWDELSTIGLSIDQVDNLSDGEPLIIRGAKGASSGSAIIIRSNEENPENEEITDSGIITGTQAAGSILTGTIGPVKEWNSFSFDFDIETSDENEFSIISDNDGSGLINEIKDSREINDLEPGNKIRLRGLLTDTLQQTPSFLKRLTVTFQPVAEGILLPDRESLEDGKQYREGEEFNYKLYFYNASSYDFSDSLKVDWTIITQSGNKIPNSLKISAPLPGDSTHILLSDSTLNMVGNNSLDVVVNPQTIPEHFYGNNSYLNESLFTVIPDKVNPTVRVRIDGRFIADGEIVSASPELDISVADENKLILLNDTTFLDVYLKRECENCSFERISFTDNNTEWDFNEQKNLLNLKHKKRLEDGQYTLRVEARDGSGNTTGEEPFLISFEVITESTVTQFYPYPNPFSDHTQFVFTLTGEEIPEEISIRIMTISGKVVKVINKDDLGPLHIGNNRSEYRWDGTDMYGDQLANGVYLYRVVVKNNGEDLKVRSTSGDKAFERGIGKLYIAR